MQSLSLKEPKTRVAAMVLATWEVRQQNHQARFWVQLGEQSEEPSQKRGRGKGSKNDARIHKHNEWES